MIWRLLARLNARVDRNIQRHLDAAIARHPSNLRRLPSRERCISYGCGNILQPQDGLICRACACEVRP